MNSNITAAIKTGKSVGVTVTPWGGDMVRLNGAMIMSAADALGWGIARAAR